jgi:hypothetical protein
MSSQQIEPNLINPVNGSLTRRQPTSHGGSRTNSGRPPAHRASPSLRPTQSRRNLRKTKDESSLLVLTKSEEQAQWRNLLNSLSVIEGESKDYKTRLDAAGLQMEVLQTLSVLRRGKSFTATPAQDNSTGDLAQLLRGLIPGKISRQRSKVVTAQDDSTTSESPDNPDPIQAPQKGPG